MVMQLEMMINTWFRETSNISLEVNDFDVASLLPLLNFILMILNYWYHKIIGSLAVFNLYTRISMPLALSFWIVGRMVVGLSVQAKSL